MPLVGAFARIDVSDQKTVRQRLRGLGDVETFDVGDPGKVGLLIEVPDLDAAHEMLTRQLRAIEGVLGVWPVSVHLDEPESAGDVKTQTETDFVNND
jgi:hypothetical protein